MSRRRICVVTATRAEYGLLRCLLGLLVADPLVQLQLVVTGMHLAPRFGNTVQEIEADGFPVAERLPLPLDDDSELGVIRAMAVATDAFGAAFARLQPDLLVLLGDRFEVLAAAQAAMLCRLPIAHLHGGESTEGVIDEAIRHAVTKMSHLHFVAADAFRRRVIQLGEAPERVWTVGATGLDPIGQLEPLSREQLEEHLGMTLRRPTFLVTYHPVTLDAADQGRRMLDLLEILDERAGSIVVTGVNADPGGASLWAAATDFALTRPDRVRLVPSLGSRRYLSLAALADAVVGNSSSGLLEAPTLGTPTVDIGARQAGRPRAPSVVHCEEGQETIRAALDRALSPDHRAIAQRRETPYGTPGAAARIANVIRSFPLDGILVKRFHDVQDGSSPC